jgi:hypothetical protein
MRQIPERNLRGIGLSLAAPMKKRMIAAAPPVSPAEAEWLRLEELAEVEITSEDPNYPIEGALGTAAAAGWKAAAPGEQTIRLIFNQPQVLKMVRLVFEEGERERRQEFVLSATTPGGLSRELVRQQFNFSPAGATREQETYHVDLPAVAMLELTLTPDVGGGDARASLQQLRVA